MSKITTPDMLAEALRMRELGFAVHWLHPASKLPMASGWSTAPIISPEALRSSYQRGCNLGFRPGKYSVVGGKEVCVLDIDIRGGLAYADEAYAAAKSMTAGLFEPTVVTGSGAWHGYMRFPIGTSPQKSAITLRQSDIYVTAEGVVCGRGPGAKPAWLIELLSTGKQVVMPPSIHPDTNKPYRWAE